VALEQLIGMAWARYIYREQWEAAVAAEQAAVRDVMLAAHDECCDTCRNLWRGPRDWVCPQRARIQAFGGPVAGPGEARKE